MKDLGGFGLWIGGSILALILVIPSLFLDAGAYGSFAAGIQAFGLIITLLFATITIRKDNRDTRVDRVVALYESLVSETIYSVRIRLSEHLKACGQGRVRRCTQHELRDDPTLCRYPDASTFSPVLDLNIVLRSFERAHRPPLPLPRIPRARPGRRARHQGGHPAHPGLEPPTTILSYTTSRDLTSQSL
jgi:hypothetical protein